jgi:hypothetical protein
MAGMKFLAKSKIPKPEQSLKYLLHQHFGGFEPDRGLKTVHASELTKDEGFCPREYALYDLTKAKPGNRWLTTSERMTYGLGDAVAEMTVEAFADMGKAICHWKCVACGYLHEFCVRPFKCAQCGVRRFKYREVRFESAITGASCGVDMLVAMGEEKLRPVELKTMAADDFKKLAAPLGEHRLRTNLYLRIIAESAHNWANLVSTSRATVLYVSKSAYGCADPKLKEWGIKEGYSPFKEFWVDRNDAETDALVKRAIVVKNFRDGLIGMPNGLCSTALSKRAQKCRFRTECFSGDHPAEWWFEPEGAK